MTERQKHPYINVPDSRPDIRMFWRVSNVPTPPVLPPRYRLRQVRPDEKQPYEELHKLAWPYEFPFHDFLDIALPGGFFGVEHLASGRLVSSCIAAKAGVWKDYPATGSLGWLVTDPTHGSQGLATTVVLAVMNRLFAEGFETVYLSTEDERLAAIHIYLKLGWQPLLYAEDMHDRWQTIEAALKARGQHQDGS
jgi:mycothiol synthase